MSGADHRGDDLDHRDRGLTCAELLEITTEYLEDALSVEDVTRFETHLARCEGCTTVLDQLRHQITATGELSEDHIDPNSLSELLDAFAGWNRKGPGDS